MPVYNKLVRDRIPKIIEEDGKDYTTRVLNDTEYRAALMAKMEEECTELHEADSAVGVKEELADILELVHAIAEEFGTSIAEVEQIRSKKKEERGGFDKKLFLVDVTE